MKIVVILNNIRSSENVGSIFRTSDAVGVKKIILVGITPVPVDRFGRENKGLTKASLGAEKSVAWSQGESLKSVSEKLKKEGFKIIGIEQSKNAINYKKLKTSKIVSGASHLALVFGSEVGGLSEKDLELCDVVAELPMYGQKESLNVSVCAGIVLYELLK